MTVSTIASIAAGISRSFGSQNSKTNAVLNSLFTASAPKAASADVTDLSAAISLQNQVAQFRVASQNVAQASSLLAAADTGANEISRELGKLRNLAVRASSSELSAQERGALNDEFQIIRSKIDRLASGTKFNNEALLDGSASQLKTGDDGKDLSIGSLTSAALFKNTNPDISTESGAKAAVAMLATAQTYTDAQVSTIKALQDGIDLAATTIETAMQNQEAANSTLDDSDFTLQLLGVSKEDIDGINSLFAQTNKLPGNILQLLSE